jgi:GNAT superfamily N-acetyltransferase
MTIRAYRPDDLGAVATLWERVGFNVPPNDPLRDVPFLTRHANTALYVDEEDGEIVGTVMGGHDGLRGWIYRLATAPEHRGEGRGRALLDAIERWLAARGLVKIQLMIRNQHGNDDIPSFYRHLGYEVSDRTVMARLVSDAERATAAARIPVVITYLEMTKKQPHEQLPLPAAKLAFLRAERLPVAMFRFLYSAVGGRWFWWERCRLSDADIAAIIHDPKVELYIFHVDGSPAGYAEIDRREDGVVNLNHLGLMQEFIGRGLGQYLLRQTVETAWLSGPERITVDTCTLDHPAALQTYQRVGFEPYAQKRIEIADPRLTGEVPMHFEPNLP